jgi:serine/threonine protein kinase
MMYEPTDEELIYHVLTCHIPIKGGLQGLELLSGKPPFTGTDPFEVAKMHLVQPLPSIQAVCPDLPIALGMVLQSALERDPTRRVASATQLATAFERVLRLTDVATQVPSVGPIGQTGPQTPTDITLPPTVNWFDDGMVQYKPEQFLFRKRYSC